MYTMAGVNDFPVKVTCTQLWNSCKLIVFPSRVMTGVATPDPVT